MSDSLFSDLSKVGLNMLSDMDLYESDRKDEELELKKIALELNDIEEE